MELALLVGFGMGWLAAALCYRDQVGKALKRFVRRAPRELRAHAQLAGQNLDWQLRLFRNGLADFLRGQQGQPLLSARFWETAEEDYFRSLGIEGEAYAEYDLRVSHEAHLASELPYQERINLVQALEKHFRVLVNAGRFGYRPGTRA